MRTGEEGCVKDVYDRFYDQVEHPWLHNFMSEALHKPGKLDGIYGNAIGIQQARRTSTKQIEVLVKMVLFIDAWRELHPVMPVQWIGSVIDTIQATVEASEMSVETDAPVVEADAVVVTADA